MITQQANIHKSAPRQLTTHMNEKLQQKQKRRDSKSSKCTLTHAPIFLVQQTKKLQLKRNCMKSKKHILNDVYFDHETVLYSIETAIERIKIRSHTFLHRIPNFSNLFFLCNNFFWHAWSSSALEWSLKLENVHSSILTANGGWGCADLVSNSVRCIKMIFADNYEAKFPTIIETLVKIYKKSYFQRALLDQ